MKIKVNQWIKRIYDEKDFGKNIAISVSALVALLAYYFLDDWTMSIVISVAFFPIAKILASATHIHWIESRNNKQNYEKTIELFSSLGREEKALINAFVCNGAQTMTITEFNTRDDTTVSAMESLTYRGVAEMTLTLDGNEAFALDEQMFTYAQSVLEKEK